MEYRPAGLFVSFAKEGTTIGCMSALPIPRLSVEEYFAADDAAELKSDFHDGEMFPISNVSWDHGRIVPNLCRRLGERLDGSHCGVATSVRIRVGSTKFVYPDVVVVCGKPVFSEGRADTITNPKVIIEVLSPSTLDYDYGTKLVWYRELPTVEDYVLVSQDAYRVEVFHRATEGRWILTTHQGADASCSIESLQISIPLADIFSGVIEAS